MASVNEQVGQYLLLKVIGRGAFGIVYLAEDTRTHLKVAIKLLKPELLNPDYQETRKNFLDEVRMLKKLKHPNILSILDDGFYKDSPYIVTEYAPGGTLQDRLNRHPSQPLPIDEAMTIISQIGLALYHAHDQHKIVHRDLKPANILFNAKGDALLADFGIATVLQAGVTTIASFAGTPGYMAPEQFQRLVSVKSDQFALGCIAYELVTGSRPFKDPPFFDKKPIDPSIYNKALPVNMANAILTAIEKDRTRRHSNVFAFISTLSPSKIKEQWLREGDSHYEAGHFEEALTAYEKAIHFDRNYANAYLGRGKALSALGRDKSALGAYRRAVLLDPSNSSAHYGEGMILRKLKRYKEALAAFEQVILLKPNDADVYNEKGIVLYKLGLYEEALIALEQAVFKQETILKYGPKEIGNYNLRAATLLRLERYEQALALYEQVILLDHDNAVAFYSKGIALYNLRRYEESYAAYTQAAKLGSGSICAYAYAGMGMALNELKRNEDALVAFGQAIQLDPASVEIRIAKGVTLSMLKRHEEALVAYEQAIQLDPRSVKAYLGKGFVLKVLDRYEEALAAYEQAILLDPLRTEVNTYNYISKANVLWMLKRYTEALAAYEQAALLDPDNIGAHRGKGRALEEMQRNEEALQAYEQCIRLIPGDPSLYNAKGRVLETLKRYHEALAAYELAIQLDSNYGDAYIGKGRVLNVLKMSKQNKSPLVMFANPKAMI